MKKKLVFIILIALFFTSCEESDLTPVYRLPDKLTDYYGDAIYYENYFIYDTQGRLSQVKDANGIVVSNYIYYETNIQVNHVSGSVKFVLGNDKRVETIFVISQNWNMAYDYIYDADGYVIKELVWTLKNDQTKDALVDSIIYNYENGDRILKINDAGSDEPTYLEYTYYNTINKKFGTGFECVYNSEQWSYDYLLGITGKPNTHLLKSFKNYKKNKITGIVTPIRDEKYTYELDEFGYTAIFNSVARDYSPDKYVFTYSDYTFNY
jgi:hypothetical protein